MNDFKDSSHIISEEKQLMDCYVFFLRIQIFWCPKESKKQREVSASFLYQQDGIENILNLCYMYVLF